MLYFRVHKFKSIVLFIEYIYLILPTSCIGCLGNHRSRLALPDGCGGRYPELVHLILGQATCLEYHRVAVLIDTHHVSCTRAKESNER